MKAEQHPEAERLGKYLLHDEQIIVATHRHWMSVMEPFFTATVSLVVIGAIFFGTGGGGGLIELLLIAWLLLFGRAGARLWEWNLEWFVATDNRILLIYGFIIRKVDMLPMSKVTDMTFHRSISGRIFGYGSFILESAGQDQALSDLHFIPDPNETYLQIVGTIFHSKDEEDGHDSKTEAGDDGIVETGNEDEADRVYTSEDHSNRWDEDRRQSSDDPTARPSLRPEVARIDREDRATRRSTSREIGSPVKDRRAGKADLSETLYSSRNTEQEDPHEQRGRWWQR